MAQSSFYKDAAVLGAAVLAALVAGKSVSTLDGLRRPRADAAMLAPSPPPPVPLKGHASTAEVTKSADGHFWAEANVAGRHVRFLVDTGATAVALTGDDAQRLGLNPAALIYDREVATAAGPGKAALVELAYVSVAGARVDKVQALVIREGLESSLLGMSYLGRLSKFEATPDALILRP